MSAACVAYQAKYDANTTPVPGGSRSSATATVLPPGWNESAPTRPAHGAPAGKDFVCLDERLRTAAILEGFAVLPEAV